MGWERKPLFRLGEAIAYHAAWLSGMEKPFLKRERPPSPTRERKIRPWVKKSIREAIEIAGRETK